MLLPNGAADARGAVAGGEAGHLGQHGKLVADQASCPLAADGAGEQKVGSREAS